MSFFCGPIQFCPHPISNERGRQKNTNKHRSWRLSPWTVRESNETYLEMVKHHVQWYVCNVAISSSMGFSALISKSLLIYVPNQLQVHLIYNPWEETLLENQLALENRANNLKASYHGIYGQLQTAMM